MVPAVRIVVDGRMLGWTGIGRYTRRLLQELAAIDRTDEFVVTVRRADLATWEPPGPNVTPVVADLRPHRVREQLAMPVILRRLRPDLVHFPHYNVAVGHRGPFVVSVQDLTMLRFPSRPGASPAVRLNAVVKHAVGTSTVRWATSHARLVLTPSRFVAGDLARTFGLPAARTVPIHLGVDPPDAAGPAASAAAGRSGDGTDLWLGDATSQVPGVPPGAPFLLHVGNMFPHKNLPVAVAAIERLAGDNVHLVLTGADDPWCARLRAAVDGSPARHRVVFTGPVSDTQLGWLYRHAALLVLPSLSEGFGLTGLEAMVHGLPVLAARSSCLPEVYGDAAAYFDPGDPAELAEAAATLLGDQSRRQRLADAGRHHASRFSWRATAEATLACYRAAAAGAPAPPGHTVAPAITVAPTTVAPTTVPPTTVPTTAPPGPDEPVDGGGRP